MALVKTASLDLSSVETVDVTFEQSLFASALKVRKTVAGLGSRNLVVHVNTADNTKVVEAAKPLLQDHDDDTDIPAGSLQCQCAAKPSGDMLFRVFVMKK